MSDNAWVRQRLLEFEVARLTAEKQKLRAEIDRQNNRYSEMSAEADRLCKMVTAFREQDDAIRAEFGGKRDGRPTIECLRKAFNAKWREEDTLFQATLDMKTEELRAEVERLQKTLEFVERWAVYKRFKADATKCVSAENAVNTIASHPAIREITARMKENSDE